MADVVVAGAGPLGASTAYHLARRGLSVTVAAAREPVGAFASSGGSLCWHRPDPRRAAAIERTATFIREAVAGGAPIDCRAVPYLFVYEGVQAPALNISSTDFVAHLLDGACRAGATQVDIGRIHEVERTDDGYRLRGADGEASGMSAVLALGHGNVGLMPGLDGPFEKRQLFVLDLPVDADRERWPHTIVRIGDGYAFTFVKRFPQGLRVVVGQEDLVDDADATGPVDNFAELLEAGVGDRFPWLCDAGVEEVLWGLDWAGGKLPRIHTDGHALFSVNAGSAVRVCIPAGEEVTERVIAALSGRPANAPGAADG